MAEKARCFWKLRTVAVIMDTPRFPQEDDLIAAWIRLHPPQLRPRSQRLDGRSEPGNSRVFLHRGGYRNGNHPEQLF